MPAKLHCAQNLPATAEPGDVYWCRKLGRIFVGMPDGTFKPFDDFVREVPPLIPAHPHIIMRMQHRIDELKAQLEKANGKAKTN